MKGQTVFNIIISIIVALLVLGQISVSANVSNLGTEFQRFRENQLELDKNQHKNLEKITDSLELLIEKFQ